MSRTATSECKQRPKRIGLHPKCIVPPPDTSAPTDTNLEHRVNKVKRAAKKRGRPRSNWLEDPDVQRMLRFQEGDEDAFDELVRKNTTRVYGIISKFIRDPHKVEDIAQGVFMHIYESRNRYKPIAKFSTFLYRIAANASFSALRAMGWRKHVPLENANREGVEYDRDELASGYVLPDYRLENDELRGKIAEAVMSLPENQRIAIILNKYEGSTYKEIAEVLNCSPISVKSLLARGRKALREDRELSKYLNP